MLVNSTCYLLRIHGEYITYPIFEFMMLLMVCLGNICRSPLAEGILQAKADKAGLPWVVDSAGTGNYHIGEAPHRLSQKVALQHGIDISAQKCRQLRPTDIMTFDKIFVMDEDNYSAVKRISGENWDDSKVSLILSAAYPNETRSVPDPWYGTEKNFKEVFDMLNEVCEIIIKSYTK